MILLAQIRRFSFRALSVTLVASLILLSPGPQCLQPLAAAIRLSGAPEVGSGVIGGVPATPTVTNLEHVSILSNHLSLDDLSRLEEIAINSMLSLSERRAAVAQVAQLEGPIAKGALERIAEANPQGGADDYEVHRSALRALVERHQDMRPLRPITRAHADEILKRLTANKPDAAFFDYDDTLAPFGTPISPEVAKEFKAAADAGVKPIILTDRKDVKSRPEDTTITESIQGMTSEQKRSITLISSRGTRLLFYGRGDHPILAHEDNTVSWSEDQKESLLAAREVVAARYGEQAYKGRTFDVSNYSFAQMLPLNTSKADVRAAAQMLQAELKTRGVDMQVHGRIPSDVTAPPYLAVSLIDKSLGIGPVRANIRALDQMADLVRWGLSERWAPAVWRLINRLPKRPVAPQKMLVVGDQFFDASVADIGMVKGAPGALAISVGGKADPRLDNIFVWPAHGREGSLDILNALGRLVPSEVDKKAVIGLFSQRTASIAVYILRIIAYPFLAVPVVGWSGYGTLMALGPVAAIATGPLNGLIVDRLSARNAMVLNGAITTLLTLALPIMAVFGVLNFWTLLAASIANGWVLSSVMTTENAYNKRLVGNQNVGAVNGLLWINYLAVQVFLGLIVGVGSIVDHWDPMVAFYISAAVNAFVALPILWFTMPNISPAPKTLQRMRARLDTLKRTGGDGSTIQTLGAEMAKRGAELTIEAAAAEQAIVLHREALDQLASLEQAQGIKTRWERFTQRQYHDAMLRVRRRELTAIRDELAEVQVPAWEHLANRAKAAVEFLKRYKRPIFLFAISVGTYFLWHSTLPIVAALVYLISTTDSFQALWHGRGGEPSPEQKRLEDKIAANEAIMDGIEGNPEHAQQYAELRAENIRLRRQVGRWQMRLRTSMLYLAMAGFLAFPLQYYGLPKIAEILVGETAKGLLLGQLLGAFFFGNIIANASKLRLPELRLSPIGRVRGERFVQAGVMVLTAGWFYTGIASGSLLVAGVAAIAAGIFMKPLSRLTDSGWLKIFGVGALLMWLPYLAWGTALVPWLPVPTTALMLGLFALGLVYGPSYVSLLDYFQRSGQQSKMGRLTGVQGSFFNAAVSAGYGLLSLGALVIVPAFPALLVPIGIVLLIGGVLFYFAPSRLPGMPERMFESGSKSDTKSESSHYARPIPSQRNIKNRLGSN